MMGGILAGILAIIILLALIGLGWDTVVSVVKKGADKVGIAPIRATEPWPALPKLLEPQLSSLLAYWYSLAPVIRSSKHNSD